MSVLTSSGRTTGTILIQNNESNTENLNLNYLSTNLNSLFINQSSLENRFIQLEQRTTQEIAQAWKDITAGDSALDLFRKQQDNENLTFDDLINYISSQVDSSTPEPVDLSGIMEQLQR